MQWHLSLIWGVKVLHTVLWKRKFLQLCEMFVKVGEHFAKVRLHIRNVATNFKLCAWMGCVTKYYVTRTQIANLLGKLPVCESVHELVHKPFYAPRVSLWFIHLNASWTYVFMYVCTCKCSEAYESRTNSWRMNWFVNWLMTWFMNWWVTKCLCDLYT